MTNDPLSLREFADQMTYTTYKKNVVIPAGLYQFDNPSPASFFTGGGTRVIVRAVRFALNQPNFRFWRMS